MKRSRTNNVSFRGANQGFCSHLRPVQDETSLLLTDKVSFSVTLEEIIEKVF